MGASVYIPNASAFGVPSSGFEPETCGSKPHVISISLRGRLPFYLIEISLFLQKCKKRNRMGFAFIFLLTVNQKSALNGCDPILIFHAKFYSNKRTIFFVKDRCEPNS